MRRYKALLERVDRWFEDCRGRFPGRVPCGRGCRDCCLGLFDVSLVDADLMRDGMCRLDGSARGLIRDRAESILARLRAANPRLGEDLDGWSAGEIDALCDELGPVECPALSREGECLLYEWRPLLCRLAGIPVVDVSGEVVHSKGCPKVALGPSEAPRIDALSIRRQERRIARGLHPGRHGVTILVPQALAGA